MAPAKLRGALNILFQLMVTIGAHNPPIACLDAAPIHVTSAWRHARCALLTGCEKLQLGLVDEVERACTCEPRGCSHNAVSM